MRKSLISIIIGLVLLFALCAQAGGEPLVIYSADAAGQFVKVWNDYYAETGSKLWGSYYRSLDNKSVRAMCITYNSNNEEVGYETDLIPGNASLLFIYEPQTEDCSFCIIADKLEGEPEKVVIRYGDQEINDAKIGNSHEKVDMWGFTVTENEFLELIQQDRISVEYTIDGTARSVEIDPKTTPYIYEMCFWLMKGEMYCNTSYERYQSAELLPEDYRPTPETHAGAENRYSFLDDLDGIDRAAKSIFYVEALDREGNMLRRATGFVAFDEHLLVTNQHVIQGAFSLKVEGEDGSRYFLDQVVVSDKTRDIAILLFPEGEKYEALEMDAEKELKRGQSVVAIGNPIGFRGTVSYGNISAFPRMEGYGGLKCIQFTAPMSHGSSGGCLFDDAGKLIGVSSGVGVSEYNGEVGENISLAVPISVVLELYGQWNKTDTETLGTERSWNMTGTDE